MDPETKQDLLAAGRELVRMGLVQGTSGNLSVRTRRGVWITPSGMDYDALVATDLVLVDLEGRIIEGHRDPSVELPMHVEIYRQAEAVRAVVHSHPVHVTALAMLGWDLPPVLDSLAGAFGGPVPALDYAPSGSPDLARFVSDACRDHPALILKNHGLIATGTGLHEALRSTQLVERSAEAFLLARAVGEVRALPDEIVRERRRFVLSSYGQRSGDEALSHPVAARLRQTAMAHGVAIRIRSCPEGARTAEDAARAVGTTPDAIVKSLVFMAGGRPVIVLVAGDRRADEDALARLFGSPVRRATPEEAREASGSAIGGVAPFAHPVRLPTAMDPHLLEVPTVWCAAGRPESVFAIDPFDLRQMAEAVMLPR